MQTVRLRGKDSVTGTAADSDVGAQSPGPGPLDRARNGLCCAKRSERREKIRTGKRCRRYASYLILPATFFQEPFFFFFFLFSVFKGRFGPDGATPSEYRPASCRHPTAKGPASQLGANPPAFRSVDNQTTIINGSSMHALRQRIRTACGKTVVLDNQWL